MAEEKKKIATRESYGKTLVDLGGEYSNLVVMDADLSGSTMTSLFAKAYPDRFFDCGIAEANMMGIAAGLASLRKVVFVSSCLLQAVLLNRSVIPSGIPI